VVKSVDKKLYGNYLRKAEEMLDVAQYAIGASESNAVAVASVHCAINAGRLDLSIRRREKALLFRCYIVFRRIN